MLQQMQESMLRLFETTVRTDTSGEMIFYLHEPIGLVVVFLLEI